MVGRVLLEVQSSSNNLILVKGKKNVDFQSCLIPFQNFARLLDSYTYLPTLKQLLFMFLSFVSAFSITAETKPFFSRTYKSFVLQEMFYFLISYVTGNINKLVAVPFCRFLQQK